MLKNNILKLMSLSATVNYCFSSGVDIEDSFPFQLFHQDKRKHYSMMRSNDSASSVFYHSQEEDPGTTTGFSDGPETHRDIHSSLPFDSYPDSMSESSPGPTEHEAMGKNLEV